MNISAHTSSTSFGFFFPRGVVKYTCASYKCMYVETKVNIGWLTTSVVLHVSFLMFPCMCGFSACIPCVCRVCSGIRPSATRVNRPLVVSCALGTKLLSFARATSALSHSSAFWVLLPYFIRPGLSVTLELIDIARLAGKHLFAQSWGYRSMLCRLGFWGFFGSWLGAFCCCCS